MTIKVAVVDDDPLVRTGLRLIFRSMPELELVGEAGDGTEIIGLLTRVHADVLLSDVHMKLGNGTTALAAVRRHFPDVRIVLMSSVVGEDFRDHALNAGAHAFVSKTATPEAIRHAIRGSAERSAAVVGQALSDQEALVAARVAAGATNVEIGLELNLSINTVKTYVSRIMSKMSVDNRVQLANKFNAR